MSYKKKEAGNGLSVERTDARTVISGDFIGPAPKMIKRFSNKNQGQFWARFGP